MAIMLGWLAVGIAFLGGGALYVWQVDRERREDREQSFDAHWADCERTWGDS